MYYNAKIEFDYDACSGCKTCFNACFIDVIRWDEENERPVAPYVKDCVACYACEIACPEQCINVIPSVIRLPAVY